MKPIYVFCHSACVPMGSISELPTRHGVELIPIRFYESPAAEFDASRAGGLIVLGGPMNVDEIDQYPFLADEVRYLRQMMTQNKPVLGICLGAQLLAKSLGSRVYRSSVPERGWYDIELLPAARDDCLFEGLGPILPVFHWHGDTFDLPPGVVHLARSENCPHQAFRSGNAWAIQFHAEITAEIIELWLSAEESLGTAAQVSADRIREIREQLAQRIGPTATVGAELFARFVERVRQSERGRRFDYC